MRYEWTRRLTSMLAGTLLVASLSGCPTDTTTTDAPQTREEAWRFLTQATFGPDEDSIQHLMSVGYTAWIDEQFAMQPSFTYRDFFTRRDAELAAASASAGPDQAIEAFFTRALTDKAQLRARVGFALSEIFVVSYTDAVLAVNAPGMMAGYVDTLDASLNGTYRDLLEAVTKSPAMGHYLTYRGNAKEFPPAGRFPDENYAREVMQLFSIGLYELNPDGTLRLDGNGKPIETYTMDDIKGLAKVFTGWGNYRGPAYASQPEAKCFSWVAPCVDPEGLYHPMVEYPAYHSTSEKDFLGVTIAPQGTPSAQASLTVALDRLASHPNTAPFISKQLIQRLVTSNPSPDYVQRVADRFKATNGNIKEVIKAILLDDEARSPYTQASFTAGKLREPLLRLTALLRAFHVNAPTFSSPDNGKVPYLTAGNTSDPATSFGQAPYFAPSVFNFFRPGYTPPRSNVDDATRSLVAPEMQITSETGVIAYFNALQDLLTNGIGPSSGSLAHNITMDFTEQRALAYDDDALVQHVADRLRGGTISDELRLAMVTALDSIQVPAPDAGNTNGAQINAALDQRVRGAVLMMAVSPEFMVVK